MIKQIIFLLFFCHSISFAQYGNLKLEQLKIIKTHKTYFVLDDDAYHPYNRAIKEAVATSWTLNSYEFIPFSKFTEMCKDSDDSFFLRVSNKMLS